MSDLQILRNRLDELKRRTPTMCSEIIVGNRWIIEMANLQVAISEHMLEDKNASVSA